MQPDNEDRFKTSEEQMTVESLLHRGQQLHSQAIFEFFARIIGRIANRKTNTTKFPRHLTPGWSNPR